jgi:hypothetical protein
MGWDNAATAIDGTRLKAENIRRGLYATSKAQGIAGVGDLKVVPLSVPGNGFRVLPGSGLVYNKYVTPIRESYSVGAATEDIFPSASMPASSGSARSHLVAVVVGDPQYSNAGHPFFPATFPGVNDPLTYQYTRTWIFQNVPAGSGQAWLDANVPYPAMALARLDMPASTTTVQASHIVDLRKMANPRSLDVQWNTQIAVDDLLSVSGNFVYEAWPDNSAKAVEIPDWATKAYINAWVFGSLKSGTGTLNANFRVAITGGSVAPFTNLFRSSADRYNILMGAPMTIAPSERGTTQTFAIWGTVADTATMNGVLRTDVHSSSMIHLRFVEEAV